MKTRTLSLIIVAALFISTFVIAQPPNQGQQWNKYHQQNEKMMKRSGEQQKRHENFFTEEQKVTMKEQHLVTAKKIKPLKNELRELQAHQKTLTTADQADLKAINKNIDIMSETKSEIAKIMAAQHQQIRSILTEEQLIKFDIMKEKRGKKQGHRNMRGGAGSGEQMHFRRGA